MRGCLRSLTIEQLAEVSRIGSRGHISNMDRGLVRPNIHTVKQVADGLGVLPLDLLTFPKRDIRQKLVDLTCKLSLRHLAEIVRAVLQRLR